MNQPLSAQRVAALRRPAPSPSGHVLAIQIIDETGSTNADLMARIAQAPSPSALPSLSGPLLLAAEKQTAGRGRAGRTWHSEPGAALTFSVAWPFSRSIPALAGLPLAVGVAVAEALAAAGVEVRLKWPNDVLKGGSKLAGILIETAQAGVSASRNGKDSDISTWAVIGIGINIAVTREMQERIGGKAAGIPALAGDRNILLAALADELTVALERFEREGFAAFAERWNQLHAWRGRPVVVLDRGQVLHEGIAAGVDANGRLLLQTPQGEVTVMAGDVSLRTMEEG